MATFEITIDDEKIQDLLQSDQGMAALLEPILNQLLQAEMTEHLRAERRLTTRVGTLVLEVPRDREGTFQTSLFERYQRSEKALVLALMQMVNVDLMRSTQGVSTRRVKKITTELCGREFSSSTVSRLSEDLDKQVEAWAERTLDDRSYPFLVLDGMQVKVRRQGAVRSTTVLLAVGISEAGQREILGLEIALGETGESWRRFIRRREKVIRIFPNEASAHRLIGALCAERHEEWSTGRRYLTIDAFFEWRASVVSDADPLPVAA